MDADYFQTSALQLNALRNQLRAATAEEQSVLKIADQMQQMRHMVYAACEVLEEVLDSSNAYQAMCLVYIALELLKRDPSPVNPFLSPLCLFFQHAYSKLQYSVQARAQLKEIADYLESTNLLPLGVTKSLQTIVSRGFDSELEGFAEAHAACVHFHAMSNDLQKLVSQDWPLDGYKQLAAELSDTTTEELRIRLQPRAAEFLSQAIAGVALCDSIIGGTTQTRAAAVAARTALRKVQHAIDEQIRRDDYCLRHFDEMFDELVDRALQRREQEEQEQLALEARAKKRRREQEQQVLVDDGSDADDDKNSEDDDSLSEGSDDHIDNFDDLYDNDDFPFLPPADDGDGDDGVGASHAISAAPQYLQEASDDDDDEAQFSS